ncbi:MAG TPA: YncE family protein [Candidatus Bathyarchaeia archaeon]|nr:YncE family protein [Candidatus Bathyarchaeia archaeon]
MKKLQWILFVLAMCGAVALAAQTSVSQYRIANRIHVEGDGFWDYVTVDDAAARLYLSHGMVVNVVDLKTLKSIATIQDTKGVHGIAIARDLNKGFITCGRDSCVAVVALDSLKVAARVPTGRNPDAVLYEPSTHRVFAYNGGSGSATVIDAKTNAVLGTIALDGKPEFSAADGKGNVWVNIEDKSMVAEIDALTMKVKARWPIAPGEEPSGMALDAATRRLFIVCSNKLMIVMDADKGSVVANLPIGDRCDGTAFDPGLKRAYSSNGDGTLTVVQEIDKDNFKVLENVATQRGARTIAVDATTHHVYLPTAEFGPAPAPTPEHPRPRPTVLPGSFVVLDVAPVK